MNETTGMWINPENDKADWKKGGMNESPGSTEETEKAGKVRERYGYTSYNIRSILPERSEEGIRGKSCERGKAAKPPSLKQPQELGIKTARQL